MQLTKRKTWDLCKINIKHETVQFCKSQARQNKNEIKIMEEKLSLLNQSNNILSEQELNEQKSLEGELETRYEAAAKGAQIRSRVNWVEQGGEKHKIFLRFRAK